MACLYIGGVNGSGKSSVGRMLAELDKTITAVSSSDLLLKAFSIESRVELRKIPETELVRARREVLPEFIRHHGRVIMDGHFNLTGELVDLIDGYMLIEVTPEKLFELRKNDPTRGDRKPDIQSIRQEISDYEEKVRGIEREWGIKVIRVKNDGSLEDLAAKVRDYYGKIETDDESWRGERRKY